MNYVTLIKTYVRLNITRWFIFELNLYLIIMSLLTILIVLIVAGVLLWLVNSYIPMDGKIKTILNVVVVIAVIIWLLKAFGLLSQLKGLHL